MIEVWYTKFVLPLLLNTLYSCFSANLRAYESVVLPFYSVVAHPSDIRKCHLSLHLPHQRYRDIEEPSGAVSPYPTPSSFCRMAVDACSWQYAIMGSLTFYQSTFEQVLSYILMNSSAFLYCVKRDAIQERKSVVCLQQISVPLVDFIAINTGNNFLLYLVNLIVRHRKMSTPLLIEHFLDTTAYGINHVKIYHSSAKTFIAEMRLRLFVPQSVFQSAWNECASVGIIQVARIPHEVDAMLKRIVLMSNTVMKSLTNGVVIIQLHSVREKRSSWHLTQCQILNL